MHSILAARTDFSIGESTLNAKQLVAAVKEVGETAIGVTDTMSISSLIELSGAAKKAEIKPVFGVRLRMSDDPTWRPAAGEKKKHMPPVYYVTAYALTEPGIQALYRLLSLANTTDRFYYDAKLSWDDLNKELTNHPDDLAVVLGDMNGALKHPKAEELVREMRKTGVKRIYAPLIPVASAYYDTMNALSVKVIESQGIEPLVVRPVLHQRGKAAQRDVYVAINDGTKAGELWFKSPTVRDYHPLTKSELIDQMKRSIDALTKRGLASHAPHFVIGMKNTDALVDACTYIWDVQPPSLPKMADDEMKKVREECIAGWKKRFSADVFGHTPDKADLASIYMPRLKYELDVLERLKFGGYFLLVQDIVQFAKNSGIMVGPGRGSVGGSLVAYLMGITECDPIRFGLLFERFINPERLDLPDADLDFMGERRHEVFEYLNKKYGAARVAGVSNYGTLGAASAIRDVGKVLGISEREYSVSKMIPKTHGNSATLPEARAQVPDIEDFADKYPAQWDMMVDLEGKMRSYGQHAAGVIVAGCDLNERAAIERRGQDFVINWDKSVAEQQGLVKVDILGLNTLDILSLALEYIEERTKTKVDIGAIPLDDPKVLKNFAEGNTVGIFQFESGGMRGLLRNIATSGTITFDEVSAATALYRPGPMESGMMESFYKRKQGVEATDYDHPLLKPVLEETYGVIVYQEQVMKISQVIAGYTGAQADKLRKIMGKKLPEEMAKERDNFVAGCVKTIGCAEQWAGQLFDKIEGFAGYGFNKSHSVEYTLISYQAMWLKTYYPVEFYAATLSLTKADKLFDLLGDARKFGISVEVPDINHATNRFEILSDTRLMMPFQRIKGVAENTTTAILEARKAGPFKDKADFLARVEKRKCNSRHQDCLDRVGAFASIEPGQLPSAHPDRIKDQTELLPGLISAYVPIKGEMHHDKTTRDFIGQLVTDYTAELGAKGLTVDGMPVKPHFGKKATIMVITDAPNSEEDAFGIPGTSRSSEAAWLGAANAGFSKDDIYWTTLIKRPKRGKQILPEEIKLYEPYLKREIEILKPTIIVAMGSTTLRYFLPDYRGKASEDAGNVTYMKDLDANLVTGFSPGEIYFSPEKQDNMDEIFKVCGELYF